MNDGRSAWTILGIFIFGAVIFIILTYQKHLNWEENFVQINKDPYGCYLINELLNDYNNQKSFTLETPIRSSLSDTMRNCNYVFIGFAPYWDSAGVEQLVRFLQNGNDAFIATESLPYKLVNRLCQSDSTERDFLYGNDLSGSVAVLNLFAANLKDAAGYRFVYAYNGATQINAWRCFTDTSFAFWNKEMKIPCTALGSLGDEYADFLQMKIGKGTLFLHFNPVVFTNYFLREDVGKEYAEKAFSYLPKQKLYWDEISKSASALNYSNLGSGASPLSFILSQPALRIAWFLLLFVVALFLFFRAKRRQRIIPVIEPNVNSSLEFVQTVGRVYHQNHAHLSLVRQQMNLFLQYVRRRFYLDIRNTDEEFKRALAAKSKCSLNDINAIFSRYNYLKVQKEISDDELIRFYSQLEKFYIKTR